MVGAALGALAAQLVTERRAASGLALTVLLGSLLLRMIADGVSSLSWLQWLSPFGLQERAAPFAGDHVLPLLVMAVLVAVPTWGTAALAVHRDSGSGRLRGRDDVRWEGRPLRSLGALALRQTRRPVFGWGAGIGAYFLLIGMLATSLTAFLRDNAAFAQLAAQAGFGALVTVEGYVATLFSLLAIPVGAFAAGRVAATVADENAGRLDLLFALPVTRVRWALTGASGTVAGAVVLAVVAGGTTWAGAAWVGAPLGLAESVAGALNALPVALLCLGAALLALGWAPHAVVAIGVLPGAGGYLLLVFAQTFRWPAWVVGLSPFDHLAAVPAVGVEVPGVVGMVVVAVVLGAVGLVGFARSDVGR
jgi:ABC-2 type transport system permease protein